MTTLFSYARILLRAGLLMNVIYPFSPANDCLETLSFNGTWVEKNWVPSTTIKYEDILLVHSNIAELLLESGNKWIVMVGDSNTRYLYYSLIRYCCDVSVSCVIHIPFEKVYE